MAGPADVAHPVLHEVNTWPWLTALSAAAGRAVDLGSVPDGAWDRIAELGCDAVWLMGVWERSPAGVAVALADAGMVASFRRALPDYRDEDVVGSPYCIRRYEADPRLGGRAGLAAARRALARRGVGLVLDFVPNHVAPDHRWTTEHPERFVRGSPADLEADPAAFILVGGQVLARGRDPYFPPWPDVVQLDTSTGPTRDAAIDTLLDIAAQCDGVRCDMAMLVMDEVFEQTWGERAQGRPEVDYWDEVIPAVRREHPDLLLIAEAYWDMEAALHAQGFDLCYDKRLYDGLAHGGAEQVRAHLRADPAHQRRLLRFIENHDEARASAVFPPERRAVAAVAGLTQAGGRLLHEGQLTGERVHVPVFLGRSAEPHRDAEVEAFYRRLIAVLGDPALRQGTWRLCECFGWPDDDRWQGLVAWCWTGEARWLVVVNLGDSPAAGRVPAPWPDLRGRSWRLVDPTRDEVFERDGDGLVDGLPVELGPWQWHLLRLEAIG